MDKIEIRFKDSAEKKYEIWKNNQKCEVKQIKRVCVAELKGKRQFTIIGIGSCWTFVEIYGNIVIKNDSRNVFNAVIDGRKYIISPGLEKKVEVRL